MTKAGLIGVWDAVTDMVSDPWTDSPWRERITWAQEHLPDAAETYRAEFFLIDVPFAMLYRYKLNDAGRRFLDPDTGQAAVLPPVRHLLTELPPAELLDGAP